MRTTLALVIALTALGCGLNAALAHGPLAPPQFPPLTPAPTPVAGPGPGGNGTPGAPGGGTTLPPGRTPLPPVPGVPPAGGATNPPAGGNPDAPGRGGSGGAQGPGLPSGGAAGGATTPGGSQGGAGGVVCPPPTSDPTPVPAPSPTPAPGAPGTGAPGSGPQPGGEIPFATAAGRRKKAGTLESATTWETWWTINRDRFIDLRRAMRAQGQQGSANTVRVSAEELAAAHDRMRKHVVPFLRRGLDDGDPFVRAHAVFALGKLGAPAKCKHIAPRLKDSSKAVRDSAVLALGLLGSGDAADLLGEIAGDTKAGRAALGRSRKLDSETRVLASLALGLAGKEGRVASGGLPVLLDLVRTQHANADIGIAAAIGLGVIGESGAIPALLSVLEDDSVDGHIRAAAVNSLGKIGDARTLAKIAAALDDDDAQVRRSATVALGQIARAADIEVVDRLVAVATKESDRIQRNFGIMALGRIGGTPARKTLDGLVRDGDLYERTFAALALGVDGYLRGEGDAAVAKLLMGELVKTKTAHERGAFVVALGLLGHREAAPYLRTVVSQPGDVDVRAHAALGLGMMKDHGGLPVLREALRQRVSTNLQTSSTIALGLIGDDEATLLLREIFQEDGFREARHAALRGLGMIGRDEVAFSLGRLLVEADGSDASTAKAFAAEALGTYGDKDDVPAMSTLAAGTNFTCSRGILDRVLRAVL